jgi:hypothetical protein
LGWAAAHNLFFTISPTDRTDRTDQVDRSDRSDPSDPSEKKDRIGSTLKGLYANDLEISFLKNLSEKTRSLKIVVRKARKIYKVAALTDGMAREFVTWSIGFSD